MTWQITKAMEAAAREAAGDVDHDAIRSAYAKYGHRHPAELDGEIEALVRELKRADAPEPRRWTVVRDMRIAAAVKRAFAYRLRA